MALNHTMNVPHHRPQYQNVQAAKDPQTGASQNGRAMRVAGVCVGLMCILQGSLNIILRLYFTSEVSPDPGHSGCNTQPTPLHLQLVDHDDLVNQTNHILRQRDELQQRLTYLTTIIDKPRWRYFQSSIYYVSPETMTWIKSREYCTRHGADLVIINSSEEQDFIEMLRRGKTAWIGLSDRDREKSWKWVDDTKLTTSFWWSQEPNDYQNDEDCVTTGYQPTDDRPVTGVLRTWNDDSCLAAHVFICEKKIIFK